MNKKLSIHPEDIASGAISIINHTNHLDQFYPEFIDDSTIECIYSGAVSGPNNITLCNIPNDVLRDFILKIMTPETKLFFDDMHEGIFFIELVHKIHNAIKDANINPGQIYYISCTINGEELYKKYCDAYRISNPINIYCCNVWERHLSLGRIKDRYNIIKKKEKLFVCFNRMFKIHRYGLLALLLEKDLVKNSYYSFFFNDYADTIIKFEDSYSHSLAAFSKNMADRMCHAMKINKDKFPMKINIENRNNKNYMDEKDIELFDNSYFSLVTETGFIPYTKETLVKDNTIFFSEKIYKPILVRHPFILVSAAHSLKYLRKIGYRTFSPFINEQYDDIENHEERLLAIVDEVERLSKFTDAQWIEWQHNVEEIVDHNHMIIRTRKINEYTVSRSNNRTQS